MISKGVRPRTGKVKKCKICNKEFYRKPFGVPTSKFCSYKCKNDSQKDRVRKLCPICGKFFEKPRSVFKWSKIRGYKDNYCSRECSDKGVAKKRKGVIKSKIWTNRVADKVFSDFIRDRDDWTCRNCGKDFRHRTGELHNSHFWSRKISITRFDPENCVALCFYCHKWEFETQKQGVYKQLMIDWLGQEKYDALEKKSNIVMKREHAIVEFMQWIEPHLKTLQIPLKRPFPSRD